MVPKQNRLKRKKDFDILFKEGFFVRDGIVEAKVWKIDPKKYPRRAFSIKDLLVGFVVSAKVSKLAVKRNKTKRQMREVVRLLIKNKFLENGFIVLLIGKNVDAEYKDIEKSVIGVLNMAKMLKTASYNLPLAEQ